MPPGPWTCTIRTGDTPASTRSKKASSSVRATNNSRSRPATRDPNVATASECSGGGSRAGVEFGQDSVMLDDRSERLERARDRYAHRRPRSRELFERASAVMPAGSTRSVLDVLPFPFRVAHAEGSRLVDVDGNEYIDFLGDYSAGLLGHDPSPIAAAVRGALERGWSYGGVHVDEIRFAEA